MKRFAFLLLCLISTAGGLALGRYVWAAPVSDAPVTRPSSPAQPLQKSAPTVEESLAALRSGPRRAALILSLAARGQKRHLPALIAACAHDEAALQFLGDTWRQTDPGAFVQALAASKAMQGSHRTQCATALLNVMERWGKQSPDDAWQGAESLHGTMRRMSLNKLAAQRVNADPRAGLEFLKQHPGAGPGYDDYKLGNKPAELLPLVQALPESPAKSRLLTAAIRDLPLSEAINSLGTVHDAATHMAQWTVLRETANRSVDEVIAFHATATGAARYAAARAVSHALIVNDPSAAAAWAQEHTSGSGRTSTIRKAAGNLASKDPTAAAALRALLPESFRP